MEIHYTMPVTARASWGASLKVRAAVQGGTSPRRRAAAELWGSGAGPSRGGRNHGAGVPVAGDGYSSAAALAPPADQLRKARTRTVS